MSGTYLLHITVEDSILVEVGALGQYTFQPGDYAYIGSAFGPGGFARINRHLKTARGENQTQHWHIDYLLDSDPVSVSTTHQLENRDVECSLAQALEGEPVTGFGASDCACDAHLFYTSASAIHTAVLSITKTANGNA